MDLLRLSDEAQVKAAVDGVLADRRSSTPS
jgi:hypothetical protein